MMIYVTFQYFSGDSSMVQHNDPQVSPCLFGHNRAQLEQLANASFMAKALSGVHPKKNNAIKQPTYIWK
jgi:hypothetical protein